MRSNGRTNTSPSAAPDQQATTDSGLYGLCATITFFELCFARASHTRGFAIIGCVRKHSTKQIKCSVSMLTVEVNVNKYIQDRIYSHSSLTVIVNSTFQKYVRVSSDERAFNIVSFSHRLCFGLFKANCRIDDLCYRFFPINGNDVNPPYAILINQTMNFVNFQIFVSESSSKKRTNDVMSSSSYDIYRHQSLQRNALEFLFFFIWTHLCNKKTNQQSQFLEVLRRLERVKWTYIKKRSCVGKSGRRKNDAETDQKEKVFAERENTGLLLEASKAIGLEVNPEKTKHIIMSRDQNIVRNEYIRIGDLSFEEVEKFKYLGATVTNINDTQEKIKRRINMGNAYYYSVEKILSSSLLSKNLKVRIYKTVILPVILYGCEFWTLTLREEQRLKGEAQHHSYCKRILYENHIHDIFDTWIDRPRLYGLYRPYALHPALRKVIRSDGFLAILLYNHMTSGDE
ncbi:hypothetical protein ANN_15504 [Periplaneta americana]|uniref:Reverse transcriptase domain-containing protein n=1 Tax=Periplaneta americana TaxID=6978 RepID=A0ABQ8SIG4_PERAM|nr:hypothetical protein ANN_15504 [Periplaneta americana]